MSDLEISNSLRRPSVDVGHTLPLLPDAEALKKLQQKKAIASYYKDTLASAGETPPVPTKSVDTLQVAKKGNQEPPAKAESVGFFDWLISLFKGNSKSNNTETATEDKGQGTPSPVPKLAPPDKENQERILKLIEQMNRNLQQIQAVAKEENSSETNAEDNERHFQKTMLALIRANVQTREQEMLTNKDFITMKHQEARNEQEKMHNLQKEIDERIRNSAWLGWVQTGADATLIVAGGISAILFISSFFTGGATLPAAIAVASTAATAAAGVAKGGTTIYKANLDQRSRKQTGEITAYRHEQDNCHDQWKASMEEIKVSMDSVNDIWTRVSQIHKSRQQAIQSIFNEGV